MNMYALACKEKFGKVPKEVSLFYLKDNKLVAYKPTEERANLEAQKARIKEIIASILKESFEPKGGFKECEWCDYEELCEGEK
jgi:CRISPR/Cas system-associated exonuclease Cas4 (RecB family)